MAKEALAMAKRSDYDAESGQVFAESSVRVPKTGSIDWIGEYKTPSLLKKSILRSNHGSRSLQAMARSQLARNMRSITADHIRDVVPWSVAEKLWDEIVSIRGESYHSWRVLASSHADKFNTLKHRYYIEMRRPPLQFSDYFKGLTSPSLDWLTCLRISPKYVDRADLVKIAKITNLTILDLSDSLDTVDVSPSQFDERVLRAWAESALDEGTFKNLRILLFGWQPVAAWIFKYLNSFPALRLLVATACSAFGQGNRKEWEPLAMSTHWEARHVKKSVQRIKAVINDESYHGAVSSMLYDAEIFGSKTTKKPVLECWLGGPPVWENVIRDFPKNTGTVWLEKVVAPATYPTQDVPEPGKRLRGTEASVNETRSPPSKRPTAKVRQNGKNITAADLLANLTRAS